MDSRITRRELSIRAVGTALALGGSPFAFAQGQRAPLKVGVLLPLSGIQAQPGQACQRGADIAVKVLREMNIPSNVQLVHEDTESSIDVARNRAEKLVNEGAQLLIGAYDSGVTSVVAQVAEQRGVPLVINVAAAPQITEQGYKYVFRNFPLAGSMVRNGLALMKSVFDAGSITPKRAVVMHVNDTFGQAMVGAIRAILPGLNLPFEIVGTIPYDPAARDLATEVARAKSSGADMLIPVALPNDAILLVREMVKQRWEPSIVMSPGTPGFFDYNFYKALGKFSNQIISNTPWYDPRSEITKRAIREFNSRYKSAHFDVNVAVTFEAVMVAADAYARATSTNGQALADALRATNIEKHVMVGGPIQFDSKGQNNNIASVVLQNLEQRPKVVLPANFAEDKLVLPMASWRDR